MDTGLVIGVPEKKIEPMLLMDAVAQYIDEDVAVEIYNHSSVGTAKMFIVCDINDHGSGSISSKLTEIPAYNKHHIFHFDVWRNIREINQYGYSFERNYIVPFLEKNQLTTDKVVKLPQDRQDQIRDEFLKYLIIDNYLKGSHAIPMIISSADIICLKISEIASCAITSGGLDSIQLDTVNIFQLIPTVIVYNGFDIIMRAIVDSLDSDNIERKYLSDLIDKYRAFHLARTEFQKIADVMLLPQVSNRGGSIKLRGLINNRLQ